jgi:hypothetical protein
MSSAKGGFNPTPGGYNRTIYDRCEFQKRLHESTGPLAYQLFSGKNEHCNKCVYDENSFYLKNSPQIIDAESDLLNITRRYSRCPQYKYRPSCADKKNAPIVMAQEVCPIIHNNIPKLQCPGFMIPNDDICSNNIQQRPVNRYVTRQ